MNLFLWVSVSGFPRNSTGREKGFRLRFQDIRKAIRKRIIKIIIKYRILDNLEMHRGWDTLVQTNLHQRLNETARVSFLFKVIVNFVFIKNYQRFI